MNKPMQACVATTSGFLFSSVRPTEEPLPSQALSPLHSSAAVGIMGCHPYTTHTHTSRPLRMFCHVCRSASRDSMAIGANSPVSLMFAVPYATPLLPAPFSHAIQPLLPVSQGTRGGNWQLVSDCGGSWGMSAEGGGAGERNWWVISEKYVRVEGGVLKKWKAKTSAYEVDVSRWETQTENTDIDGDQENDE